MHSNKNAVKYVFQMKQETKLWQLLPARQIEEEKKTPGKKTTKCNISSEARGKMIAAVANKATHSCDRSCMYSICKEEDNRIEYTCIVHADPERRYGP